MKLKNSYFYTLRENVKDEDSISGNLLVRSGMIKKASSGIYMFLPMGLKVLEKIKKIIKEEMDKAGAQELLMPSMLPREIYDTCGRADAFGPDMFKFKDRYNKEYVLGPTHEEMFAIAAKSVIRSYKDLPFTIYQQADKFRDEPRPRYGLIRVREFIMKDAYSFDKDEKSLDESYQKVFNAYKNIFDRIGVNYKIVRADTGAMGGSLSEEFQAVTDIGEDTIVLCDNCSYASNIEVSDFKISESNEELLNKELVETKDKKTIEEVSEFLNIDPNKCVKAILLDVNEELVACFIRGDREINENKICKMFNIAELKFASEELISKTNAVSGYCGPIDLNAKVVIDEEILHMKNFVVGANKKDYHYINVNINDFKYDQVGNISNVKENDICPKCNGRLYFKKGIEIGNTFKLGTKYAKALNLTYLDENNKEQYCVMGSYGIGPGRVMASIVEQNNDENGIIWPTSIAPYDIAIVAINSKDEEVTNCSNKLYETLIQNGYDVLLDDRDERPGVKFKDMELIGIPYRIEVGARDLALNKVTLVSRKTKEKKLISIDDILDEIKNL
ncbi:MAG TPA: proline--tRNA ligase [Bacilli bacterium]|nr:proline--tRNA ligase [Bacilli bacterium]